MTGNYPVMSQSEEDKAPFNEDINKPKEVEVTVSITLSKTFKIEMSNYYTETEIDEDNNSNTYYTYSDTDLKQAVRDQITLPDEAFEKLHHAVYLSEDCNAQHSIEDLKDWNTDDFEVVLE